MPEVFNLTKTFSKHMLKTDFTESASNYRFTIGDVTCDISEGVIEIGNKSIQLEPRLRGVFALLVQRGRTIITRDEFLETVWDNEGSDEALTQAISRLRKILGESTLIETVPRIGYRLALAPKIADTHQPLGSQSSDKTSRFLPQNIKLAYACILLVVVGATAFWLGTFSEAPAVGQIELEFGNR